EESPRVAALRARFRGLEEGFESELRARGFTADEVERVALPGALSDLYAEVEEARAALDEALAGEARPASSGVSGREVGNLAGMKCVPCYGGVPRLTGAEIGPFAEQLPRWEVVGEHHLRREYEFTNFRDALRFVNRVGEVAEREGHHPDVRVGWGYAHVEIYTHAIDGLSESDFVLAAKLEALNE
ncbi:MAG TPA: 4a-hydroxytetrahydrobiopterin dehydratase, partial [Pyrinomonadaceae bacterium]|nr:4a-hydroxytetrahydrobiopterin dehydratase [Pyrinomonadaceae bacterium]